MKSNFYKINCPDRFTCLPLLSRPVSCHLNTDMCKSLWFLESLQQTLSFLVFLRTVDHLSSFNRHTTTLALKRTITNFLSPTKWRWQYTRAETTLNWSEHNKVLPLQCDGERWGWWSGRSRRLAGQDLPSWWRPRSVYGTCMRLNAILCLCMVPASR